MSRIAALFMVALAFPVTATANPMRPDPTGSAPVQPETTVTRKAPPALPRLDAIIIIGDLRKAIFRSDQEITLGESINGYRLIDLDPESVTLQRGSVTRKLTLTTPGEFTMVPADEE